MQTISLPAAAAVLLLVAASAAAMSVHSAASASSAPVPESEKTWMNVRDSPEDRAKALLAKMNTTEKLNYLHGWSSPYTGSVPENTRLGIPQLRYNDGPQGFRDNNMPGSTTSWPSALTVSMTWDRDLMLRWGEAMGAEFWGKGANVQLGPGVCVARIPKNGRNFEYVSGESGYLGHEMVQPLVNGIQSQGVIANAKHYIDNNQETNRNTVSENVDERTNMEIYTRPFAGAAKANVGSVMCSYNKINDRWSCENNSTLNTFLKEYIGFKGYVMSDWGATHSTSINEGLDQEMPGASWMGDKLAAALAAGNVTMAKIDDSVLRILTPMFQVGLFDRPNPNSITANVTSDAHRALARALSAASQVLLKNDGNVLPLNVADINSVAVIGAEAATPTVHGGGSGQVIPASVSAPLDAIRAAMGIETPPPPPVTCDSSKFLSNTDFYQPGNPSASAKDVNDCCQQCGARSGCQYFSFVAADNTCWFKASDQGKTAKQGVVSGSCYSQPVPPPPACSGSKCVYYDDGSDLDSAVATAKKADVAIVFGATSSHEGGDRDNLNLNDNQDQLIQVVAGNVSKSVVVVATPGALLTDWRDAAKAIITSMMPGEQYGNALADVLFGKVNPSGRLAITFPNKDNEQGFTPQQWPGVNLEANYSEGLYFGYRWYDKHNVQPAFAFGHGLSYTNFTYSSLTADGRTVAFTVTNTGSMAGAEVPQLYLGFPATADEPPKRLRGFDKIFLDTGASQTVYFTLQNEDVSVWDTSSHAFKEIHGTFDVYVGASSRDIRLHTTLTN